MYQSPHEKALIPFGLNSYQITLSVECDCFGDVTNSATNPTSWVDLHPVPQNSPVEPRNCYCQIYCQIRGPEGTAEDKTC